MPTKRFSTRSRRPTPCLPPISFSRVSNAAGDRVSPSTATGSPRSKAISTYCGSSGARGQIPLAPGCNDLDVGSERIIAELEADLVVTLAGGAVSDGIGTNLAGDLDLAL